MDKVNKDQDTRSTFHPSFSRYTITSELIGSARTVLAFGLFLIPSASETCRFSRSLFSSVIALSIVCFRCLIEAAGRSLVLIRGHAPKTKSTGTRLLDLTESLIAFTAIGNKTSLLASGISISRISYSLGSRILFVIIRDGALLCQRCYKPLLGPPLLSILALLRFVETLLKQSSFQYYE